VVDKSVIVSKKPETITDVVQSGRTIRTRSDDIRFWMFWLGSTTS
jgi:uncharacterized protein YegJ (DUF2314 family)